MKNMPLSGNDRTFARIFVEQSIEDALDNSVKTLEKMKLKAKEVDNELHLIQGKTKPNFLKNTWGAGFRILVKPYGNTSVIDIYFNGVSLTLGPDTGGLIDKFYDNLCKIISKRPQIEVSVISLSDTEIESKANEKIHSDNVSDSTHSVADEIAKLSKLKADGAISEEEYMKMKNDLIDKM